MDILFPYGTAAHWVSSAGFVITLWLGTYIATHVPRRFPSRLAFLSLFTLSGYFLHVVLCLFLPAEQAGYLWRRYMGWISLWPLPIWLHLSATLLSTAQRSRQRLIVSGGYFLGVLLSVIWVARNWSFSRETLLPPELVVPVSIYAVLVGGAALLNINKLRKNAADKILKQRHMLLGAVVFLLISSLLYWPVVVNWIKVDWSPVLKLAIGDMIPLLAALTLAYSVAYQNMFMSGRWLRQDFFYNAATVMGIAGLYLITMKSAQLIAEKYGFDVPTLVLIFILGLSIFTQLISDRIRELRDSLFNKKIPSIGQNMRGLIGKPESHDLTIKNQMYALVNRLKELTGASTACVAMLDNGELIIRTSTDRKHLGRSVPLSSSSDVPVPALGWRDEGNEPKDEDDTDWYRCLVLAEPIRIENEIGGYLLLGDQGVGEGYDREERLWVSGLAAHLGAALEKHQQLEETAKLISELKAEAEDLRATKKTIDQEFEAAILGSLPSINRQELREAVYSYNDPEKLAIILNREENTLAQNLCISLGDMSLVKKFQLCLQKALEAIAPPNGLPPIESLPERSIKSKRRRHLPASVANYYTLQLVMAGYSHEDIAEMMGVSPRQVRNYLDRSLSQIQGMLEDEARILLHTSAISLETPTKA